MDCPSCHKQNHEDAIFCNYCGKKLRTTRPFPDASTNDPTLTGNQEDETFLSQVASASQQETTQKGSAGAGVLLPYETPVPGLGGTQPDTRPVPVAVPQQQQAGATLPSPQSVQSVQITLPTVPNKIQQRLIQTFQPSLASNPWFGMALGSLVALVLGLVTFGILSPLTQGMLSTFLINREPLSIFFLNVLILHNFLRDTLELFLTAHGIGINLSASGSAFVSVDASVGYSAPLNGLLVFPAIFLTFGGYIAACTDFSNRARSSLWRGAAIAAPYTFLLFLLSTLVNGITSFPISQIQTVVTASLSVNGGTLLIFGLLWGIVFGTLGAFFKLSQGQWRRTLYTFLHTNRRPHIVGAISGSVVATALGCALTLLCVYCLLAYTSMSSSSIQHALGGGIDWRVFTVWGFVQGPLYAVMLFAFSMGAQLSVQISGLAQLLGANTQFTSSNISLVGSDVHFSALIYLVLLIPIICLFLGGRTSVALAKVQGTGPAVIQGALVAIPFTILMVILVAISSLTASLNVNTGASTTSAGSFTLYLGVPVLNILLWSLLFGGVFGALGGAYHVSSSKQRIDKALFNVGWGIVQRFQPFYALLDRLAGQPLTQPRSRTRHFLYGAVIAACALLIISVLAGIILIGLNQVVSIATSQLIQGIIAALLFALPGVLLIGAASAALVRNPIWQGTPLPPRQTPETSSQSQTLPGGTI